MIKDDRACIFYECSYFLQIGKFSTQPSISLLEKEKENENEKKKGKPEK